MITLLMMLAAAPNPAVLDKPRKAYQTCLKGFETKSIQAKMAPADYSTAIKTACGPEATALMNALISFDVAMGSKRASATTNAERDVEDYRLTSEERFKDLAGNQ